MRAGYGVVKDDPGVVDTVFTGLQRRFEKTASAASRAAEREAQATAWVDRQDARRRTLNRMADEVSAIRDELTSCQAERRDLAAVERTRPFTPDETDRVRALRWQTEQLRWQLGVLSDQFEQVRQLAPRK